MIQDFTVQKKQYSSEKKKFVQRGSPEKKIPAHAVSEQKKILASWKFPIPPPPPSLFEWSVSKSSPCRYFELVASSILLEQGHPTTVCCKISVRRSKYCLKFSITWGRLKISRWLLHSCTIFEAFLTNSLRFSEV